MSHYDYISMFSGNFDRFLVMKWLELAVYLY